MEAPQPPGSHRDSVESVEGSSQESTMFQSTSRGPEEFTDLSMNLSLAGTNAQDFFFEGRQITDAEMHAISKATPTEDFIGFNPLRDPKKPFRLLEVSEVDNNEEIERQIRAGLTLGSRCAATVATINGQEELITVFMTCQSGMRQDAKETDVEFLNRVWASNTKSQDISDMIDVYARCVLLLGSVSSILILE